MLLNIIFAPFLLIHVVSGYSIGYFSKQGSSEIHGSSLKFSDYPNAYQVADIFSRLGGRAPLLWEGIL